MTYILPDLESVELIHNTVLVFSVGRAGVHDKKLLQSAVNRPESYANYVEEYDLDTLCAVLIDSLARYHGFEDGNKRTALMAAIYTYKLNGVHFAVSQKMNEDFDKLVMWVVNDKPDIEEIRQKLKELRDLYEGKEQTWAAIFSAFEKFKLTHGRKNDG